MRIKKFNLAARQSDLARLQAYSVGAELQAQVPGLAVEYHFRRSLGDQNQHDPLWKMPERGVFTEDFREDLIHGRTDCVVHSWKDLPVEERSETVIAATLKRADPRDVFLLKADREEAVRASKHLRVLSSSPRRAYNLQAFLPLALPFAVEQIEFVNVRGNVPTRLAKLLRGEGDALVVAKAALDRLLSSPVAEFQGVQAELREALRQCRFMVLPLSVNPTAAAQGALAIEVSRSRPEIEELVRGLDQRQDFADVVAERELLKHYGGGCHQKIGLTRLTRPYGTIVYARGLSEQGESFHYTEFTPARPRSEAWRPSLYAKIWPDPALPSELFTREPLAVAQPAHRDLYVARADALPESWQVADHLIWTAGVKSWRKLASRGIWVHGCSDNLGEQEDTALRYLLGREPQWLRLTHADAVAEQGLATYRLNARSRVPTLAGFTHFFWMSGSQFDQALKLEPQILNAHHSCGPGASYRHIARRLGGEKNLEVFLSYEQCLEEMRVKNGGAY